MAHNHFRYFFRQFFLLLFFPEYLILFWTISNNRPENEIGATLFAFRLLGFSLSNCLTSFRNLALQTNTDTTNTRYNILSSVYLFTDLHQCETCLPMVQNEAAQVNVTLNNSVRVYLSCGSLFCVPCLQQTTQTW